MKILALLPARGGSKRLPGKNTRMLGSLPLIAWTIRAAQESGCCTDILVSTDDPEIADVSRGYGASVPWMRPDHLATDTATSVDVAIHALERYEAGQGAVDGLLLLQPTSPFRSAGSIRRAVDMFGAHAGRHPVVGVSPAASHPAWCFKVVAGRMVPFLGWPDGARSQDLEPAWALNGGIYLIAPSRLRADRALLTPDALPLLMEDTREAADIDTLDDFLRCERWL